MIKEYILKSYLAQSAGAVEYANCIPKEDPPQKLCNGEALVGNVEYHLIAITPWSIRARSGNAWESHMKWSNRNVWHLNCV